ncbi:MAG: division/cell wall cluster transcriptional repressor MraZ [Alphaproteobacteria bacterium]|nr:division/cell wall cluster transcriptional repressor MraZ [Alphaproteobacteria bacterium]
MSAARPFLATFTNKIDAKGRLSVPAKYREILEAQGARMLYCRASFNDPAIMAGGAPWISKLTELVEGHDPSSEVHDDFAYSLLGETIELTIDPEGRVMLPPELIAHARIGDAASFVGLGGYFEIWEPRALQARLLQARRAASERRGLLRAKVGSGA